jgi:hypothetical protein
MALEFYTAMWYHMPVSMAERSKSCAVYDRSNIWDRRFESCMDVCLRLSVLCCPVSVEALRWTDPPTKESYQMSMSLMEGKRSA